MCLWKIPHQDDNADQDLLLLWEQSLSSLDETTVPEPLQEFIDISEWRNFAKDFQLFGSRVAVRVLMTLLGTLVIVPLGWIGTVMWCYHRPPKTRFGAPGVCFISYSLCAVGGG